VKTMPPLDFRAPANAKFAMVGPNREAFRPGTEPSARTSVTGVEGGGGGGTSNPFAITPITPIGGGNTPPSDTPRGGSHAPKVDRPPKKQDELNGLY
jgi:penicillin-binding protein 1A